MKIYLVGGAVRDQLLGLPVQERDYVVVGATPEEMLAQGYKQVGKDFPVFLHPETHEEYALARTERKTGRGYTGFAFYAAPEVTLEEDLKRRDLTVNAMAQDENGKIIDPYHGQEDLNNHYLRHVSAAFIEDPVRILRVARFAARFAEFQVHPDTMKLMQEMVRHGEVDALVPERVWQEFSRALKEKSPQRFLEVLQDCDALPKLFPEISDYIPAKSSGKTKAIIHLSPVETLKLATKLAIDPLVRFASLWIHTEPEAVTQFCQRNRVPSDYRDLAQLAAKHYDSYTTLLNLNAGKILDLLEKLDAFRRPERFNQFLQVGKVIEFPLDRISKLLQESHKSASEVSIAPLLAQGLKGPEIASALRSQRIIAIEKIRNTNGDIGKVTK